MRSVGYPDIDAGETYEKCIGGLFNEDLKNKLMDMRSQVEVAVTDYVERAENGCLYKIVNEIDKATGKELINVYEYGMRDTQSCGRAVYDLIRSLPEDNLCPFCSHRRIAGLDHILPKSKYPVFSVIPHNLVAICGPCNQLKGDISPTSRCDGVIHPYFEDIDEPQWLHAEVNELHRAAVEFFVKPIEGWEDALNERVANQFRMLKLKKLYSDQAASEMSIIQSDLQEHFDAGGSLFVKRELHRMWQSVESVQLNSWRTACYKALRDSEWYCSIGYKIA